MRLINTHTLDFREFFGLAVPPYAILSHTWEDGEVSLREMSNRPPNLRFKKGYRKIVDFCHVAADAGYTWAWADTCCIDNTNHAELTESINSMFRWYQEAAVCLVFLSDLTRDAELKDALPRCRWLTRGWTLQELLAPAVVEFYDREWILRGTKQSLLTELVAVTGIMLRVLDRRESLPNVAVGVKMSWAAGRKTTRPEDIAYCLLGIFDINMPLIYGEGKKAFRRLQEEIIRQTSDMTIFAWGPDANSVTTPLPAATLGGPLLAPSPHEFGMHSGRTAEGRWSELRAYHGAEYAITNKGLRSRTPLIQISRDDAGGNKDKNRLYFVLLGVVYRRNTRATDIAGMILDMAGPSTFVRRQHPLLILPGKVVTTKKELIPSKEFYIEMDGAVLHGRKLDWLAKVLNIRLGPISGAIPTGDGLKAPGEAIHLEIAVPESHWDRSNRRFFLSETAPPVFALSFSVMLDGMTVGLLCLVDHEAAGFPNTYIIRASEHPELRRWFHLKKLAMEGAFWEELPEPWPQKPSSLLKQMLKVEVGDISYFVRLRQGDGVAEDTLVGGSYTLFIDVEKREFGNSTVPG